MREVQRHQTRGGSVTVDERVDDVGGLGEIIVAYFEHLEIHVVVVFPQRRERAKCTRQLLSEACHRETFQSGEGPSQHLLLPLHPSHHDLGTVVDFE